MTPHALIAPARLAGIPLLRTQTDERLVDLVRAGNDAAFEAIVARYRRQLVRHCSRLLPEERAEDAVQQTFVSAYDALRASGGEMHLRAWLFRIAHNTALNALRDGGRAHEELSEQIDGVERPDQALEKSQRVREVLAAVQLLPERQRDAIVQRELEGRSYDEIAASIGVSNGAVRQLLNRARMTLRAGATAVTPFGLLARVPWTSGSGGDAAVRVAEICGGTAGGAVLAKACATALVSGAVLGGAATVGGGGESEARPERSGKVSRPADAAPVRAPSTRPTPGLGRAGGDTRRGHPERSGSGEGDRRRPARAGGGRADRSGPGAGGDAEGPSSNSGPGSGDRSDSGDRSGSGSGGSGGSGSSSGPGSGGSGSGDSGSGSSGSGSSGSGSGATSGSGSGSSGSGSSGSSGSGSSSGSGDPTATSGSGTSGSGGDDSEPAPAP